MRLINETLPIIKAVFAAPNISIAEIIVGQIVLDIFFMVVIIVKILPCSMLSFSNKGIHTVLIMVEHNL